ncbi:HdeD family acid-resistance protein [Aestuariivirga sp. YIM B02566]|uniref:HdeD family acid-resistance protein n=1 Tax=Taklimakanibacter albus TaxID=2800327 RepID=A0ACC5R1F3_9HYPH|nr:HdeD family acid-resistance protein [Aestuariivirga sp. YIM B02566]MBK1866432.1 HdeD family acid-resistance protein [Aestuariivirga sp. YIM B02566]
MAKQDDSTLTIPVMGLHALARNWWLLLLRGIAAILFGLLAFAWPGITLISLVILYGFYALFDGLFAILAAIKGGNAESRWWLILIGILGVAAGLLTFFWTGITALVLTMFIGAWALIHGIFEIIGAIKIRKEIDNEWWLILSGALSVLFGLAILIMPGAGALALIWVIGAYAIVFGGMLVGFAFRLKKHSHADKS